MAENITGKERVQALMTASPELTEEETLFLTGNEYLSLPEIGTAGEIRSVNVLHMGARGLLEFRGTAEHPLLAPFVTIDDEEEALLPGRLTCRYRHDWIPISRYAPAAATPLKVISSPAGTPRLLLPAAADQPLRSSAEGQGRLARLLERI